MWTYIKKDKFDEYISSQSKLQDAPNELILHETEDAYFLPRLFATNYPSQHLEIFTGKQEVYEPVLVNSIRFKGELRDEQVPIINRLIDIYNRDGFVNGIVKARPGLGKTVLSVYLACQLKMKTLIIVDNQNLMKQWIKAFLEFTNLTEEHIGIIQQKHFGIDRPIIIAMAQTLVSKVKDIKNSFKTIDAGKIGLVMYDEVHATSSASVFSKISLLFRTRNILGLSATPFHIQVAEILMKNTIGEIIYETKQYDLTPEYRLIYYKSDIDNKKVYVLTKLTDYLQRKAMYNKLIVSSQKYLNLIIDQTRKARTDGHRIIIICFTKIQVTTISDLLTANGLTNKKFYGDEKDIEYDENILVATYSFCGKGWSRPT